MTPDQIKQLRANLRCTARELATTLDVPLAEIQSWEAGDRFPTKQWVDRMQSLGSEGPQAVARKPRKALAKRSPMDLLDNPEMWQLFRKLVSHPELFAQALQLAASYEDPAVPKDRK